MDKNKNAIIEAGEVVQQFTVLAALLLQRTGVQFLAPTSSGSQLSVTPGFCGPLHPYAKTQTHVHTFLVLYKINGLGN